MKRYDIAVIGGGFAGAAAAIAAARKGASVLLMDKSNALGGAAVNCLVNPFMVNGTRVDGSYKELSQGLFLEIRKALNDMAGSLCTRPGYGNENTFSEEFLKIILNRMAVQAGVNLLFHAYLTDVQTQGGKLVAVIAEHKSGKLRIEADRFIDATGDLDLAVKCGCDHVLGRPGDNLCQPMTLCFRLGNVDMAAYKRNAGKINGLYQEFRRQGKIKNIREDVLIFHTVHDGVLHFNTTRIVRRSPVDAFDLTAAEIEAREQVFEMLLFLRENIGGFENASLLSTAAEIGVRESRMLRGEYVLTGQDIVACTPFADSIAVGNYDIDIHNPEGSGTSHYYFPAGQYYQIPYRALLPKEIENLLVAGRCISVDHEAQASVRILPIVCCLGEAAGLAAYLAAQNRVGVKSVDVKALQGLLWENGACFG